MLRPQLLMINRLIWSRAVAERTLMMNGLIWSRVVAELRAVAERTPVIITMVADSPVANLAANGTTYSTWSLWGGSVRNPIVLNAEHCLCCTGDHAAAPRPPALPCALLLCSSC